MHNFYSNFLKDYSRIANRDIIQCKFVNFLNSLVIIDNDFENELVSRKTFIDNMTYCNFETLTIIECYFINCTHNENDGGAIEFKRENCTFNANVTIYSSTFDRCSATDGSGGAIFVCNEKHTTDFVSNHTNVLMFNSSYCCYSKCSAYTEYTNNTHKGYGSVMFIFADKIDLINLHMELNLT